MKAQRASVDFAERAVYRRAVEAAVWGMPAVNYQLMFQEMVDKGKGGQYLFLPPDFKDKAPDGYIPMQSDTYQGYALVRSILKASFFESLDKIIQAEPWLERDKAMIDPLKTIGIERGKPFKPDARRKEILNSAMQEAHVWLDARIETMSPFYDGGRWFFPITEEMHQSVMNFWSTPDSYPVETRGMAYTLAFFSGKHIGEARFYLLTTSDRDGNPLRKRAAAVGCYRKKSARRKLKC